MSEYQIITDATSDLEEELEFVKVIPMNVKIAGEEYIYGPNGNISCKEFYDLQRKGHFASTSQINILEYEKYFEETLKECKDVLYVSFSSGMSGTYQTSCLCRNQLIEKYPNRKIVCVDSLCASVGEGFFIKEIVKKYEEGLSLEELKKWIEDNRDNVCHWFTVDMFDHLKHGGRVSAVSATLGNTLHIKPLLHVDEDGKLQVVKKIRGKHKAMTSQIEKMESSWLPQIGKTVVIGHGDNIEGAKELEKFVKKQFPDAEIYISEIGPIIGAHTGPGILVLGFWGIER